MTLWGVREGGRGLAKLSRDIFSKNQSKKCHVLFEWPLNRNEQRIYQMLNRFYSNTNTSQLVCAQLIFVSKAKKEHFIGFEPNNLTLPKLSLTLSYFFSFVHTDEHFLLLSQLLVYFCFIYHTGEPRYMRSFYLRIHVYAIRECRPKFIICEFLLHFPRIYAIFN